MYCVYVIQSSTSGKIYIGQTRDLNKRIQQHNDTDFDKRSYTTLNKGPWRVIYKELYGTRGEALKREQYLKSHIGRDFIRNKILEGR